MFHEGMAPSVLGVILGLRGHDSTEVDMRQELALLIEKNGGDNEGSNRRPRRDRRRTPFSSGPYALARRELARGRTVCDVYSGAP